MQRELKYVFRNERAPSLAHWLRLNCRPDPKYPRGIITSIYYDTRDWRFLKEKLNSDYLKTKIRVRWYADLNNEQPTGNAFVEAKFREGSTRRKQRVAIDVPAASLEQADLEDESLLRLPRHLLEQGVAVDPAMTPVFSLSYKRQRFVEPCSGLGLCIDYDITVPRVNRQRVTRGNPYRLKQGVIEVKGPSADLPQRLYPLTVMGARRQSFSKYGTCHAHVMNTQQ